MATLFKIGRKSRPEAANVLPIREYLRAMEMFRDLPPVDLEHFAHALIMKQCTPGTIFFTPEDTTERLFILKEGEVVLYRLSASGKRLVLAHVKPVTIFGEMGLLGQSMHGCFAESVADSLVCIATRDEVLGLLRDHPETAIHLLESVGNRLHAVEERLAGLALRPVPARLATILLSQANADTMDVTGLTHAELGDMIGAMRQTVTETLASLQRDGVVEVHPKSIRITDPGALRNLAEDAA